MKRSAIGLAAACLLTLLGIGTAHASPACDKMRATLAAGGGGALMVVDAESGRVACTYGANRVLPLASNMKLFTTATALAELGPGHRIETKVLRDGPVDSTGRLRGSLYLQGGGDPALGTPGFYGSYFGGLGTNLFALRPQIRRAGIEAMTGRLYADDTVFDRRRGVADSGYATSYWIGPLSGLAFNAGFQGNSSGSGFSSDPARLATRKLARSLRRAGIAMPAQVARRAAPARARQVAVVRSPALTRIADLTNVYSNNFMAEMTIKLLGAERGRAGTTAAGAAVIEAFARRHGSVVQAVDGSGLTRTNAASPREVIDLLLGMRTEEVGEEFIQDLPLTGAEGTVASRTRGTPAYRRCRVKTGTLTGVSNLSGYCFNPSGRVMAFSVLQGSVGNLGAAHAAQDRIAGLVASY